MKKNFLISILSSISFALLNTTGNTQTVGTIDQPQVTTSIADTIASKKESLVNLLDFKTRKKNNAVSLEWVTESETAPKYFEIERSSDGITYYKIGEQDSKNTKTKTSHSFLDENPLPVNYYRLKAIHDGGDYSFSKVIAVNRSGAYYSAIQPNPFVQSFAVNTFLPSSQAIKIQLLEMNGRLVRYKSEIGIAGTNKIQFDDLDNLQPGMYMVRIITNNSVVEKRLIKANQ